MSNKIDWSQYEVKEDAQPKMDWDKYTVTENKKTENPLQKQHPYLYALAEKIARHPTLNKAVDFAANYPGTEATLSAFPAFLNAVGNAANAGGEIVSGEKFFPKVNRPFPEPKGLLGQIGSQAGNLVGQGFAMSAGGASIPAAILSGFLTGEGGAGSRAIDAGIGLAIPGALHVGKSGRDYLLKRALNKEMSALQRQKFQTKNNVDKSKIDLSNAINNKLEPIKGEIGLQENALEQHAGTSESFAKNAVSDSLKLAKKTNREKYSNLYESFNKSKEGQAKIKEPLTVSNIEKELGINPSSLSPQSRKLIDEHIGTRISKEASEQISPITGKPVAAAVEEEITRKPKVEDYINLWKQLRDEAADYNLSASKASTHEAKVEYSNKAEKIQSLADAVNKRIESTLPEKIAEYQKIQEGYKNEVIPFKEKPLLQNATDKFPEIPDGFFEKLNNLGATDLVQSIKSNYPAVVDAITRHDLRGLQELSQKQLKPFLRGDFGRFITSDVRSALQNLYDIKTAETSLKKALSKVQSTRIGRSVRGGEIRDIIRQHPDLAKPFKIIEAEQEKLEKLTNSLTKKGFEVDEINKTLSKYKKAGSLAKAASLPLAGYLGLRKGQKSNDLEQ